MSSETAGGEKIDPESGLPCLSRQKNLNSGTKGAVCAFASIAQLKLKLRHQLLVRMVFGLLLLCVIACLQTVIMADIPGIPDWAQDLARCAPGGPPNSVVRGLRNPDRTSLLSKLTDSDNPPPSLFSRPLLSRRPKRMGFADDANGGIKRWPFIGRFEFAELQNWFPRKHMISNVGTLIAPDLVLTARHVIDNIEPDYQKKVTRIYFGSSNRWAVSLSDTSRTISEISFFPDPLVDLAILKLNAPVNCFVTKIAALVPLAKGRLDDVYHCKSASWGKDRKCEHFRYQDNVYKYSVSDNGQCPQGLKEGSFRLFQQKHEYEICARGFNKTLTNVVSALLS